LQRAGRLSAAGRVVGVARDETQTTLVSTLDRFRPEYAGDGKGAPVALVRKRVRAGLAPTIMEGARREAEFYREVAPLTPAELVPQCFEALVDDAGEGSSVLLEDFSATHHVPDGWPVAPPVARCEQIIDAYARFH